MPVRYICECGQIYPALDEVAHCQENQHGRGLATTLTEIALAATLNARAAPNGVQRVMWEDCAAKAKQALQRAGIVQ